MSSGSAQLLVELMPSKPHIIGPRNARSEAQNSLMRPPIRFAIWSIAVGDRSPCLTPTTPLIVGELLQHRRRQRDADAGRVVDQHAGARERDDVAEERDDLRIRHFRYKRRRHHRQATELSGELCQFADHANIRTGGTQHDRHPIADNVHDAAEQVGALFGRHRRKLAVGAADQDAVEAEADHPLHVAGKARIVETAIGLEWRHGDVEQATQPRLALR